MTTGYSRSDVTNVIFCLRDYIDHGFKSQVLLDLSSNLRFPSSSLWVISPTIHLKRGELTVSLSYKVQNWLHYDVPDTICKHDSIEFFVADFFEISSDEHNSTFQFRNITETQMTYAWIATERRNALPDIKMAAIVPPLAATERTTLERVRAEFKSDTESLAQSEAFSTSSGAPNDDSVFRKSSGGDVGVSIEDLIEKQKKGFGSKIASFVGFLRPRRVQQSADKQTKLGV
ncbi:hypothetical protein J6590_058935 [Homalodisca vitripennis]|nr:hypothetical protein J6590_058935 [Homalodisca vitripennis]